MGVATLILTSLIKMEWMKVFQWHKNTFNEKQTFKILFTFFVIF